MAESHKFPDRPLTGLIYPNVISVKMMQRSTGLVRVVDRDTLESKLSNKMFTKIFNDVDMMGEYLDDRYHVIINAQGDW